MRKCDLCGGEASTVFKDKEKNEELFLCKGCMHDVENLCALSVGEDVDLYNQFKKDFLDDYKQSRTAVKFVGIADRKTNPSENKSNTEVVDLKGTDFMPFKLQLATIFAVVALFLPFVSGLILAFIARNMSNEIPVDFSPADVKRARRLSSIAIAIKGVVVILFSLAFLFAAFCALLQF